MNGERRNTVSIGFVVAGSAGCASAPSVRGSYTSNLVQINKEDEGIDYCDAYGTVTFHRDGTGNGTETRKCTLSGSTTEDIGPFTYTVESDGTVLITEVGYPDPTHAKIVDRGRMLLIDGTTRSPKVWIMHGVAVKK